MKLPLPIRHNFRICPQAISPGEIILTRTRQFYIDRCACSCSPKNSVRCFLAQVLLFELPCPPEPGFDRSIASDLFTFWKKNSRWLSQSHSWPHHIGTNNTRWKCDSRASRQLDYEPRALLEMSPSASRKEGSRDLSNLKTGISTVD